MKSQITKNYKMKFKITNFILLILCFIFIAIQLMIKQEPTVLRVITPTIFEIDTNNNGFVDDNEVFCIPNDYYFTSNLKYDNSRLANAIGVNYEQAITIGYLTDEFAKKTLEGQRVKIIKNGKITPNCNFANIYLNNKNYEDILRDNGFYITKNNYKILLEKAKNLKLVILNHKSLKYHTLDCEYGRAAEDAIVLPLKELSEESLPCKFCHIYTKNTHKSKKQKTNSLSSDNANTIVPPPNIFSDGNIKLLLSDYTTISRPNRKCNHQVCKEFVNAIKSASQTIDIAAYGFDSIPEINSAIEEAISRGVRVRLVYDIDSNNSNYYPEIFEIVKIIPDNKSDMLKGQPTYTNMLMHNKFAIFDKHKVYTGSMNFSATGFSGFNHNNVAIINSDIIADIYTKEFEQMYNGKFHTRKSKTQQNTNIIIGNSTVSVYFSPQDKQIAHALIPLIRNSKQYIYVPAFIITHNQFKNELIAAKNRGIDVKIILDATSTNKIHSATNELKKSNIPVKIENYAGKVHSKTVIIDDEYVVVGSTNFSSSGENKNDENMLIIKNNKLAEMYKDFFLYLWNKIPEKYLKYNISAESKESQGSCSDNIDNDYDGKIDKDDDGCK